MATQASLNTVQSLYVAYYGRPADPSGLQYWAERLEASDGNLSDIINAFGNSAEYRANIGNLGASAQVNSLYQQLFGRDAEDDGLSFYTNMLNSGEKTLAEIALTIREAAEGTDRTTFEGRTAVANAFTQELDTPEKVAAYSTERGIGIGRDYLKRVNEQTSSDDVLSDAAPVADTLIPETPPTDGGNPTLPEIDFTATLVADAVVFGGNATGAIELTEVNGAWTFTRATLTDTVIAIDVPDIKSITLGSAALTVDDASLLDGIAVTGTGQLTLEELTSDLVLGDLDDTLTVTATVTSDQNISLNNTLVNIDTYTVESNYTLTLTAAQANGVTIKGESFQPPEFKILGVVPTKDKGGSVEVVLDGGAYDLSKITAGAASSANADDAGTLIATLAATATLNEDTDLGDFTLALSENHLADVALTLSAAQATERKITGDDGDSVIVEGLAANTDLSGLDSDIDLTANVAQSIDISSNENLGSVDTFVVENNAVFTLSARQADEQVVETEDYGTVVVSGSPEFIVGGDNDIDLTSLPAFTFENGSLVVPAGVTVTLTAAQADGKVITGAGNVQVEDLGDARVDLSSITVTGNKIAEVKDENDQAVTLHTETKLGGFTLAVLQGNTLTMTAAQANDLTTLTTLPTPNNEEDIASAIINGTFSVDELDYSGKDSWDIDKLTINGLGGDDFLKAPANVENVTLNGDLGDDSYVVDERAEGTEAVQLGDFNMKVDVLSINEGGIAAIDLTDEDVTKLTTLDGDKDLINFTAMEDDDRLTNSGMLIIEGIESGDSVAGTRGADTFVIEGDIGYFFPYINDNTNNNNDPISNPNNIGTDWEAVTITNYAEEDVIDLSELSHFTASSMEVRESDAGGQIAVEFDGHNEGLLLDGALDRTVTFTGANFISINGNGDDTIKVNIVGDIDADGTTDDVNLIGGDANQTLTGGAGDDFLFGGAGENELKGGAGDDKLYATNANTIYNGGEGDDSIVVYQTVDISGASVSNVESLNINHDLNSGTLTVTISEDQLGDFVDFDGESTIEKGKEDRIELDADADMDLYSTIELAGSDGILHAITNLHGGDKVDFSGLVGDTVFTGASDIEGNVIGFETGEVADIENSDPAVAVDAEGEWQFDTSTAVLTYFDGTDAQTITLTGINFVTADGSAELGINLIG